jgi:hypothetical protein
VWYGGSPNRLESIDLFVIFLGGERDCRVDRVADWENEIVASETKS